MEGGLLGEDLAQLLYKVFKSGHEQEDEQGAARAAQSAVCKLEIKVRQMRPSMASYTVRHMAVINASILHTLHQDSQIDHTNKS